MKQSAKKNKITIFKYVEHLHDGFMDQSQNVPLIVCTICLEICLFQINTVGFLN